MRDEEDRHLTKMKEEELLSEQRKLLEILKDQNKIHENEIWQMFELCLESWEPTKRNIDSIAEKARQQTQRNEKQS